jgi:RNA polymerase sigma-70 factor, ECF subfamily
VAGSAGGSPEVGRAIARAHHEEWARVVAVLVRQFGDLDIAEESTADAFAIAVERWRAEGVPENPGGWLTTTARRKALDRLRRDRTRDEKYRLVHALTDEVADEPEGAIADERLRLLLMCCHPALPLEGRVALTLRMVGGLTVPEIARAFLVRETTMGQRISRAKAKVRSAGIPLQVPSREELPERVSGVLTVLYLVFNEGYLSTGDHAEPVRQELALDAIRLTRLLRTLLPREGEVAGLLALMLFAEARRAARVSPEGELLTLGEQNRRAWNHAMIREGDRLLEEAAAGGRSPGRYRLLAAISATHCSAVEARDTDWPRIVALYDGLARVDPSPVVLLNRAVAVAEVDGPGVALGLVDRLHDALSGYHAYFAVRADLLRRLQRAGEAIDAYERAIALAGNTAEKAFLNRRRDALRAADRG